MTENQNTKALYEILEEVHNAKNEREAIKILKQNECVYLLDALKAAFDPAVKFMLLPDGEAYVAPKYKPSPDYAIPSDFRRISSQLKTFIFGPKNKRFGPAFTMNERQTKFMLFLESIHPKDAEIVARIPEKKMYFNYMTEKLVRKAFPDIFEDFKTSDKKAA